MFRCALSRAITRANTAAGEAAPAAAEVAAEALPAAPPRRGRGRGPASCVHTRSTSCCKPLGTPGRAGAPDSPSGRLLVPTGSAPRRGAAACPFLVARRRSSSWPASAGRYLDWLESHLRPHRSPRHPAARACCASASSRRRSATHSAPDALLLHPRAGLQRSGTLGFSTAGTGIPEAYWITVAKPVAVHRTRSSRPSTSTPALELTASADRRGPSGSRSMANFL
jgi:hypothetical protein